MDSFIPPIKITKNEIVFNIHYFDWVYSFSFFLAFTSRKQLNLPPPSGLINLKSLWLKLASCGPNVHIFFLSLFLFPCFYLFFISLSSFSFISVLSHSSFCCLHLIFYLGKKKNHVPIIKERINFEVNSCMKFTFFFLVFSCHSSILPSFEGDVFMHHFLLEWKKNKYNKNPSIETTEKKKKKKLCYLYSFPYDIIMKNETIICIGISLGNQTFGIQPHKV